MYKCKSSNIDYIKYDPDSSTLEVCFKNGGVYHYHNVGQRDYNSFLAAESHGKHFAKYIKDSYKFTKQEKKEKDKKDE